MKLYIGGKIVALRNEKGSYSTSAAASMICLIVALRNEKGSYSRTEPCANSTKIVALRNEKGSYSLGIKLK